MLLHGDSSVLNHYNFFYSLHHLKYCFDTATNNFKWVEITRDQASVNLMSKHSCIPDNNTRSSLTKLATAMALTSLQATQHFVYTPQQRCLLKRSNNMFCLMTKKHNCRIYIIIYAIEPFSFSRAYDGHFVNPGDVIRVGLEKGWYMKVF